MIILRKIWRDTLTNKTRTLLVVLSIAIGVFALGVVLTASAIMRAGLAEAQAAAIPEHIVFWLSRFDQETIDIITTLRGVADAEGDSSVSLRWKLEGENDWRNGLLVSRPSYDVQHMNVIKLVEGDWPGDRTLVIEKLASQYFNAPVGSTVVMAYGRRELRLPVTGAVYAASVIPPQFGGDATFYTTPETRYWLTGDEDYDQLHIRTPDFSKQRAEETARRVQRRLEAMDIIVNGYSIADPDAYPLQSTLDTVFLILTALGAFALGLSAFLIINTINAIITQQIWQIGVMKVLGATSGRVIQTYLLAAIIYGLLALALAAPAGAAAGYALASWLLSLINIEIGPLQVVPVAVQTQVVVALVVPVAAALLPALRGARITPNQAIRSYGLGGDFGQGLLDGPISRLRGTPRPLALTIRNLFRRKLRLLLAMTALVLGGALFMIVMSISASLTTTIETIVRDLGLDIIVVLQRPYRATLVAPVAQSVPGVARAEMWDRQAAMLAVKGGQERTVYLWGVPPDSPMVAPRLVAGRQLLPEDGLAIVLNQRIAQEEGITIGDVITLTIGDRESAWTVAGLMLNVNNNQLDNYTPFEALQREAGVANRGATVAVKLMPEAADRQHDVMLDLRTALVSRGVEVSYLDSANDLRARAQSQFSILVALLLAMSLLAALVGSVGLAGTLSISVVERSREIGVMRAIGATSWAIVRIVAGEGILLAILSWLIAVPLSIPSARRFGEIIGLELLDAPLDFRYTADGALIWLGIILILSALASLLPAQRAARISVREALAYE